MTLTLAPLRFFVHVATKSLGAVGGGGELGLDVLADPRRISQVARRWESSRRSVRPSVGPVVDDLTLKVMAPEFARRGLFTVTPRSALAPGGGGPLPSQLVALPVPGSLIGVGARTAVDGVVAIPAEDRVVAPATPKAVIADGTGDVVIAAAARDAVTTAARETSPFPPPAQIRSRPPRPLIVSAPALATMTSACRVPRRVSAPVVPTIVATLPWHEGVAALADWAAGIDNIAHQAWATRIGKKRGRRRRTWVVGDMRGSLSK